MSLRIRGLILCVEYSFGFVCLGLFQSYQEVFLVLNISSKTLTKIILFFFLPFYLSLLLVKTLTMISMRFELMS